MKFRKLSRRKFLIGGLVAAPFAVVGDAKWLEPSWVKVRHFRLNEQPVCRLAHITDIHHKGDRKFLESVVELVNAAKPDLVCMTGDIMEESRHLPEALEILGQIQAPIFGVPGNHDYWAGASFGEIEKSFARKGGGWLLDRQMVFGNKVCLTGATCITQGRPTAPPPLAGMKNVMLVHYPMMADRLAHRFDLVLAGHSHGGQVRIPFYGALVVPYWVGRYEVGMFETAGGPLYVNPGIGWLVSPIRFNCRPEVTIFEV